MNRNRLQQKYERDIKRAKQNRDQFFDSKPVIEAYIQTKRQKLIELYKSD